MANCEKNDKRKLQWLELHQQQQQQYYTDNRYRHNNRLINYPHNWTFINMKIIDIFNFYLLKIIHKNYDDNFN